MLHLDTADNKNRLLFLNSPSPSALLLSLDTEPCTSRLYDFCIYAVLFLHVCVCVYVCYLSACEPYLLTRSIFRWALQPGQLWGLTHSIVSPLSLFTLSLPLSLSLFPSPHWFINSFPPVMGCSWGEANRCSNADGTFSCCLIALFVCHTHKRGKSMQGRMF